jgi:hypothetical protein
VAPFYHAQISDINAAGIPLNTTDVFDSATGQWSTAELSVARYLMGAVSVGPFALFGGGTNVWGALQCRKRISCSNDCVCDRCDLIGGWFATLSDVRLSLVWLFFHAQHFSAGSETRVVAVDIYQIIAPPIPTAAPPPPNTTSSLPPPPITTAALPVSLPASSSPIPAFISFGAAATSGHLPRVLELLQFLSLYCTSLSLPHQNRLNDFQISSFTHIASSKSEYCKVCPGSCVQPLVLVVPTLAVVVSLFVLGLVPVIHDAHNSSHNSKIVSPDKNRLLEGSGALSERSSSTRPLLRRTIAIFCLRYMRGFLETCSSYMLMPCTFVFVLNVRTSSFAQADSSDRAMIVMIPVFMLLFRALVIRQRVVNLTLSDQKLLCASSACSCAIAVVLSVSYNQSQSNPSFSPNTSPQYTVLALLAFQLLVHTFIRLKATDVSFFDNTDWPWSNASSAFPEMFSFRELRVRLVMGSIRRASSTFAIAVAKFLLLNYMILSQMIMVSIGLASSRPSSSLSIETSSILIGSVPLITSGVLLLYNLAKFTKFVFKKCARKLGQKTVRRRSDRDSLY